jgi:hypothetical protein
MIDNKLFDIDSVGKIMSHYYMGILDMKQVPGQE